MTLQYFAVQGLENLKDELADRLSKSELLDDLDFKEFGEIKIIQRHAADAYLCVLYTSSDFNIDMVLDVIAFTGIEHEIDYTEHSISLVDEYEKRLNLYQIVKQLDEI